MEHPIESESKVLIIDDEPTFVEALTWWLNGRYQVTAIVGGKGAVEIIDCENGKFDVILCDLNMPQFDGVDLHHFLSKKYPGLENRLIFLLGEPLLKNLRNFSSRPRIFV